MKILAMVGGILMGLCMLAFTLGSIAVLVWAMFGLLGVLALPLLFLWWRATVNG